jgi:MinD-like ATPase involved in chromosome partitioning or flagellar assembly
MTKIVSIHSFRGGTGKSNITANLAAQIAMQHKKVGIVDTDFASPGIHVLFGLNAENMTHCTNEFLRGKISISEAAFNIGEHPSPQNGCKRLTGKDIWLLPASISRDDIQDILQFGYDVNELNRGLTEFRKEKALDYLFIDTHPGIQEETLLALAISDILLLIARPDQQDMQGTSVVADIAKDLDVPDIFLVVNKLSPKFDQDDARKDIITDLEKQFEIPVCNIFLLTHELVELGSADLFSLLDEEHRFSKEIKKLSQIILNT